MSTSKNANNVSEKIYATLTGAVVDSAILNGVIINGYSFTLTDRTKRNGIQRFEKGMIVDLNAYLSPNKNTLYLNSVCLSEDKKPAISKPTSSDGTIRNLSNVAITALTDKSVSLDGTEYFFSRHTENAVEPVVGLVVDAVIYETAKGRMYLNALSKAESSNEQHAQEEQKDYRNNNRQYGYIAAITDKAIRIGNQWYNLTERSVLDDEATWAKGEYVCVYYYASPKGGNYINRVYKATDKYAQKTA